MINLNTIESCELPIDDKTVKGFTVETVDYNLAKISVGTTGFKYGNSETKTVIRFEDLASTSMTVYGLYDDQKFVEVSDNGFELHFHGDAELRTAIDGFRWIAQTLEMMSATSS